MSDSWVTFDCFGTLVDWNRGFAAILEPVCGARTAAVVRAYHEFELELEAERPHRRYRDVLTQGLLRATGKVGVALSQRQAAALPDAWATMPVFTDVEAALAALRAAGNRLAVLTNCDDDLFALTARGFSRAFDLVVTAEKVCDYKPSLSHFRYFSRVSGVNHADWTHVACSGFHDLAPARELGIKRIWLDRDAVREDRWGATLRLESAVDLAAAVNQLRARLA